MDWTLILWIVGSIIAAWLLLALIARIVIGAIAARQVKKVFATLNDTSGRRSHLPSGPIQNPFVKSPWEK